jgi:hypothetical protein
MHKILIKFNELSFRAELNDSPTSRAIWEQLPLESQVNTWGEEIYFEIPVEMPQEPDAQEILSIGDLAFWPVGQAFCIFFGPTPVSTDERPRAYSPVNLLGKILADVQGLKSIRPGDTVHLEKSDQPPPAG